MNGLDLNLNILENALCGEGFSVEIEDGKLYSFIQTKNGEFIVFAAHGGIRMGKPNGTVKYYWGSENQCMAVIRQTLKSNNY